MSNSNVQDAPTFAAPEGDASDAGWTGYEKDASAAPPPFTNQLCNWSTTSATNACYPDDNTRCEATPSPVSDAGATDGGASDDAGPFGCRLVKSGTSVAQRCTAAGQGQDGTACQTSADCAPKFECVGSPGVCRHYCCDGDRSCGTGSFCDIEATADTDQPTVQVPVCAPVTTCTLVAKNCDKGSTCAIVKDDGTTGCVAVGPAQAGDACDVVHCAADLTCLGKPGTRQCYKICEVVKNDCSPTTSCKGSAQLFTDPKFGICQ